MQACCSAPCSHFLVTQLAGDEPLLLGCPHPLSAIKCVCANMQAKEDEDGVQ